MLADERPATYNPVAAVVALVAAILQPGVGRLFMDDDTVGLHMQRFLHLKLNRATRTWYAKYLAPMVAYLGEATPVRAVRRADAEAYWQALQARRDCWEGHPSRPTQPRALAPVTLANHLRAARTFWNLLVRQRVAETNPFDHLKAPKDTRPAAMKAIAAEDLRALWRAALHSSARDFALLTVMATCGVRAGELVSMTLRQTDLRTGLAWVKGKRGWRKVYLGRASVQAIHAYLPERPDGGGDALWLNVSGAPLTSDGVRQLVDRLAERAGITGRHNLHAFRHRVAQAWLDQGINAQIVAQALGHADVTVTLQIYGNQDDRRVAQAVRQAEMAPFHEPPGLLDVGLDEVTEVLRRPPI